ncbi:LpxD N-terminal domain-containing protein [Kutzneria sp. CA-103260]|uniref:LpxD N-terminal domain-containing protein n=1 Tax=Kutzneria sp. CA-103260 TaxID=2802641 RepID=UPI001BA704A9|nr:LpxD N-terminal domain-containing protein [Kutzneria sp. CA-103260]QUQ66460.1 UDP-3-O-acylglucosamine N-acyltransferase [Kutzneria sp. CA-103260]
MPWTLAELASVIGAEAVSSPGFVVTRPVPADSDDPAGLAFCANAKYLRQALAHGVGALILPPGLDADRPHLRCADPRLAFARFLELYRRPLPLAAGVHATAVIDPSASVDVSASIGPYAVVERGAVIGPRARCWAGMSPWPGTPASSITRCWVMT